MIRLIIAAAALVLDVPPVTTQWGPSGVPAYVADAVASPLRSPRDIARDASQKPAEILAFAGVKPGDKVADFWPTPPYSTALLSGVVGPKGHVYGVVPPKLFKDVPPSEAKVRGDVAALANVTLLIQPFDAFAAPEPLDVVWLGKIYHDFPNAAEMGPLDIAKANRAIFSSLKPGGILIVIDHAAKRGSGFRDTEAEDSKRLHRIDADVVEAEFKAAGFRLEGASLLLANPADDHGKSVFDPAVRNKTDRFVYKFRKPN